MNRGGMRPYSPSSSESAKENSTRNLPTAVNSAEPVWVQKCLVEKHISAVPLRKASPCSSAKNMTRKSHRDHSEAGWQWLLGYAQDSGPVGKSDRPRRISIQDENNDKFNHRMIEVSQQEYKVYVLPANVFSNSAPPKNLIDLIHLHEPALVHSLQVRFAADKVYTLCGAILIALNPFADVPGLYGDQVMQRYRHQTAADAMTCPAHEPHIYAVADAAFRSMQQAVAMVMDIQSKATNKRGNNSSATLLQGLPPANQSILISGESGAGKTFNTKMAMRYLATLSRQHTSATNNNNNSNNNNTHKSMEQQVLQSNPILEAFGNARTIRNDNSSRFGKLIVINFSYSGCILSARIDTYLLEKVRLVRQAEGERNYHIFYQLLLGFQDTLTRKQLAIDSYTLHDFKITSMSGTLDRRDGIHDTDTFQELLEALDIVGFSNDEQMHIFRLVAGLLHMSNLNFQESTATSDSSSLNQQNTSLQHVLDLFGVCLPMLSQALCTCTLVVRGETMIKNLNIDKAEKAKEALMKATYGALFEHVVHKINQSTASVGNYTSSREEQQQAYIQILDIFGFESFYVNSFEQLCINYCNEALQAAFNRVIFQMEQAEYEREGIQWSFIDFPTNQDVLELIERKHVGILSLLDEQSRLPKCSDQTFANSTYEKCMDHPRFSADKRQQASGLFQIHHYAGPVEYSSISFLDKNKDELPKEATDFLLSSNIQLLQNLGQRLHEKNSHRASNNNSPKSVGGQFATQLRELRDQIDKTNPHFVRCLKPNDDLVSGLFHCEVVADQLRCAGVLEAVRVSRTGFPQRFQHALFVQRYGLLASSNVRKAGKRLRNSDYCTMLVSDLLPRVGSHKKTESTKSLGIQMGSTKVFFRQYAFDAIEKLRTDQLNTAVTKIQSLTRMFLVKKFYKHLRLSVVVIQKTYRMIIARRMAERLRRERAVVRIQSIWRGYKQYTDFSTILFGVIWAQRTFRGGAIRRLYRVIRLEAKAKGIQSWWRMLSCRQILLAKRSVAVNVQQLYRCKRAKKILKGLRIEARSLSNVVKERDEFKKELQRLKQELAVVQYQASEAIKYTPSPPRGGGNSQGWNTTPIGFPKVSLNDTSSVISSVCNESIFIESILEETAKKDLEIERLRREVQSLKQFSCAKAHSSSMNTTLLSEITLNIYNNSLLDSEESYDSSHATRDNFSPCLLPPMENHVHLAVRAMDDDALSVAISCTEDLAYDLNQGGLRGQTPLHLAVLSSKLSMIEYLLENESIANVQDDDGNTPLHLASSFPIVKLLLLKGNANPNIPNNDGICALHNAVRRFDVESCRYLIKHNANVNAADHYRWLTPLHVLMLSLADSADLDDISPEVYEIVKLLVADEKSELNEGDKDGNSPLHLLSSFAFEGMDGIINLLLAHGANPQITNHLGQTPLFLLLHNRQLSSFKFFPDLMMTLMKYGTSMN